MTKSSRRSFLKAGVAMAGALASSSCTTAQQSPAPRPIRTSKRKPNLLFFLPDQQRADTLACYGNRQIQMPHVNRLADESVVFDNAYVTQPVCTPARSSLLTGLFPHANGMTTTNTTLTDQYKCLPEMLPKGEYKTGYHGKWHLGDECFAQHGFEDWVSAEDYYFKHFTPGRDQSVRSDYHHWLLKQGLQPQNGNYFGRQETRKLPEHQNRPAFLAQEASRFIKQSQDNPFMLFVSFLEPHTPYMGPWNKMYDPKSIPLPGNFGSVPGSDTHLKNQYNHILHRSMGYPPGANDVAYEKLNPTQFHLNRHEEWQRVMAHYWGLCSLVDKYTGQIIDTLRETGQLDNTIIVYTSDHGDMMCSHQMLMKSVQYEEACRVPMLVRLPGGEQAGKRISGRFSHIDLLPTLMELMDQPVPTGLHGKGRRNMIESSGPQTLNDDVFIEWNPMDEENALKGMKNRLPKQLTDLGTTDQLEASMMDAIRTVIAPDGWKLNCSPMGMHELFNLKTDPGETTNLARKPEHQSKMRELRGRIVAWQKRTGDTVALPEV